MYVNVSLDILGMDKNAQVNLIACCNIENSPV